MKKKITILDYGLGNITSIVNALNFLKYDVEFFSNNKKDIDILIIPGVGSFDNAMKIIRKKKYFSKIKMLTKTNTKIIGICLGMQILLSIGFEGKKRKGLNLIAGKVPKIDFEKKLPLVGYFPVDFKNDNHFNLKRFNKKKLYHIHSYAPKMVDSKNCFGFSKFNGNTYLSAIYKKNIVGFQFHPEKSGKIGIELLNHIIKNI